LKIVISRIILDITHLFNILCCDWNMQKKYSGEMTVICRTDKSNHMKKFWFVFAFFLSGLTALAQRVDLDRFNFSANYRNLTARYLLQNLYRFSGNRPNDAFIEPGR
jgi:hypothetical protein